MADDFEFDMNDFAESVVYSLNNTEIFTGEMNSKMFKSLLHLCCYSAGVRSSSVK